jgi:hypothetical protein
MIRTLRLTAAALAAAIVVGSPAAHAQKKPAAAAKTAIAVYKSPTCGCCSKWIDYMRQHGFAVTATNMPDVTPVKVKHGVPAKLASCHTSLVGGYVIEGHVPVTDIQRLLRERPKIAGLAAPGMPAGSPGMDVPNSPPYDVLSFDAGGRTRVYSTQPATK